MNRALHSSMRDALMLSADEISNRDKVTSGSFADLAHCARETVISQNKINWLPGAL